MTNPNPFRAWALVEIFGHAQIAGELSEQTIGGCSFIRVDVPEVDGQPAFTRFFGQGAIYSITPVSEEIARVAAGRMRVVPVNTYYLPAPARPPFPAPGSQIEDGYDDDDPDDEGEGEGDFD